MCCSAVPQVLTFKDGWRYGCFWDVSGIKIGNGQSQGRTPGFFQAESTLCLNAFTYEMFDYVVESVCGVLMPVSIQPNGRMGTGRVHKDSLHRAPH